MARPKNTPANDFDAELDNAAASGSVDSAKIKIFSDRVGAVIFADGGQTVELKYKQIVEVSKPVADMLIAMHPGELRVV